MNVEQDLAVWEGHESQATSGGLRAAYATIGTI